ncbi:glycosyltransferase family 2 protein [Massilia sp. YIM B02763]|uniref:glycosyltransferase family 2 protein n=1 Tax=Massilia sp. YIM B02763 TaxID=3050130 RepID=UPI0025B66918|nr:glycosyltransferase family 2 protein [Massilia sp. YIM B02763]MDN4051876.1 glycosyltransferase family 2 protein [Massilia sp. YIM B02763]
MFKPCVVIPVYNHEHAIGKVLARVLQHGLPVILVDDGSSPTCAAVLDALAAAHPGAVVLERHAVNQGKGGAVLTGFARAEREGYSHVLQVDADGQHDVADVPRFLDAGRARPHAVIAGCPLYDESVPALRLYARYLTHVWVWINTLSLAIRDSMCGFRVYPVAPVLALARRRRLGLRMNFDIEILVRLYWDGLEIANLPTRVGYPEDGVSHFQAWTDNVLISRLHMTLFFGMLPRVPSLLVRSWRK